MAWRGNPSKPIANKPSNPINFGPEMSGMKKPDTADRIGPEAVKSRAFNVRRDTDKEKNFSVSLIDVDSTILTYIDTVINPTVVDAGRQVKVPINYASPERWKAIRKDGYIRDKNGKIQCPAIAFRRSTMQRNDQLQTFNRYLQYPTVKQFSEKNKYDKFSMLTGFNKVKEIYSVAMPDHVIINYEFIIWTELIEQGNEIVEAVNFSTEDYWGDKNRYKFRTSISDYNFETEVSADSDRIVKSTFTLMVYAYLLPDKFENYKSVVEKSFTPRKIIFDTENTVDIKDLDADGLKKKAKDIFSKKVGGFPTMVQYANRAFEASFAVTAQSASFAATASYLKIDNELTVSTVGLTGESGGPATGSFGTNLITGVNGYQAIDSFGVTAGNAALWLVSVNDGANFKTNEVAASWDNSVINYYVTEVSSIGTVPVVITANNVGGTVSLVANPLSGTWTVKLIRMIV
jgi:hypothetical protein